MHRHRNEAEAPMKRWLTSLLVLLLGRGRRGPRMPDEKRLVERGTPERRAESLFLVLLLLAGLCAAGFIAVYAIEAIPNQNQFLGLSLGLTFVFLALACIVAARRLVVTEEKEEDYPVEHPSEQEAVAGIVDQSGSRFTRKRLVKLTAAGVGTAVGAALVAPAVSLGPILDTSRFYRTPWKRGRRIVDEKGRPLRADEISEKTFYTAYPENYRKEDIASPIVIVRIKRGEMQMPPARSNWTPDGIVAYSKICTHAGCAIALYRAPLFSPAEPKPALVCPCHYSTFNPANGGEVTFGPAGRPLPQLPLMVDKDGYLRAAGNFSGAPGPAWWGVYMRRGRGFS
jgi:ubiquinol-cytochrome c reductase iron-sulfur subunit